EVIRKDRPFSQLGIVYDASSHDANYPFLNSLHIGPNLYPEIFDIFLRFRLNAVAFTADMNLCSGHSRAGFPELERYVVKSVKIVGTAKFCSLKPFKDHIYLLSSLFIGVSESVQEFAARIKKLGTQIFQSGNSIQTTAARNANDQLLQSHFISGLRNDIRRFVLARDPNTLEESINVALIEEQNLKLNEIASNERSGLSAQVK
ncbi:hypothetical protein TNCV_611381, partial [Trichonephila clavipes]